ncbi:MAG: hypothetical protein GF405_10720 [Candidatus Eisenbacteria bacterium]|nr:hypothetical protein [Candidatus Eisenbacteria bacterium]
MMRQENAEVTVSDVLGAVLHQRWRVFAVVVVFTLAAIAISYLMTPVYRASTLLAPSASETDGMMTETTRRYLDLAGLGGAGAMTQRRQELIALLGSRQFTYEFIREEGVLPELYPDEWDEETGGWHESAGSDTPSMWNAYRYFDTAVRTIFLSEETGLITLSVEWTDPGTASEWANSFVGRANRYLRDRAVTEAERSLDYLSRELQQTSAGEVRDALYRLVELEMQKKMLANVRDEYGFEVLDPAVPPEDRVSPNRRLIALVGLVLGALAGAALALHHEGVRRQRSAFAGTAGERTERS